MVYSITHTNSNRKYAASILIVKKEAFMDDILLIVKFIVGILYLVIAFGAILSFITATDERDINKALRWFLVFLAIDLIRDVFKHLN